VLFHIDGFNNWTAFGLASLPQKMDKLREDVNFLIEIASSSNEVFHSKPPSHLQSSQGSWVTKLPLLTERANNVTLLRWKNEVVFGSLLFPVLFSSWHHFPARPV
jgi:hypothetical protein